MTSARRVAQRAGWGVADQVLSSLINFGLGIAIARVGTTEQFGAYGLVFGAYLIAINVTRPLAIEPLIIRFTGADPETWRSPLAAATAIVAVGGVAMGAAALVGGLVIGGFAGLAFVILGLGLPGLVLQDGWRLSFFAEARGRAAFLNDLAWLLTFSGLLMVGGTTGRLDPAWILAAWAVGAGVAAGLGLLQAGRGARPRWSGAWWAAQRDLARPLLGEHIATNVINELVPYAVGGIAGLAAVGALRAAQLLLGPFNVLFQALSLIALPEAVRQLKRSRGALLRATAAFATTLVVAVLATGAVLLAVPLELGSAILGESWSAGQEVLAPYTVYVAAGMAMAGASIGLRALGAGREILRVGVIRSILGMTGAVAGAASGGAATAALGLAIGHIVGTVVAWRAFGRAIATGGGEDAGPVVEVVPPPEG